MQQRSDLNEFAIILRTCDIVSPKYPCDTDLSENKEFHIKNIIKYSKNNAADLFIVCDTGSDAYYDFVCDICGADGTVVRSTEQSNEGSFRKQIELVEKLPHKYIEIAEDDFLKSGVIDLSTLSRNKFYTAYAHPLHDRYSYKLLSTIFDNEFTTVCSFIGHRDLILRNKNRFLRFGKHTDAEVWRSITTPWLLELAFNLKNNILKLNFGNKHKLKRLDGVTWIHVAADSLPNKYAFINDLGFNQLQKIWSCMNG